MRTGVSFVLLNSVSIYRHGSHCIGVYEILITWDIALEWEEVLIKAGVETCICGYAYDLYQTSINYSAPNYFGDFCPAGFCTNQATFQWQCENGNVVQVSK